MKPRSLVVLVVLLGLGPLAAAAAADPSAADYAAAAKLLYPNLKSLVRNESVFPHWFGVQGQFWYQRDGQDGREFVVVSRKGVKSPAFDHEALADALYRVIGRQSASKGLPASLTDVSLSNDVTRLTGRLGEKLVDCDLKAQRCRLIEAPPPSAHELLPSPDGSEALLTRDNNLFMRDMRTGNERALTSDGLPSLSWATAP
jgi:dipeptidyl-peptidase 4